MSILSTSRIRDWSGSNSSGDGLLEDNRSTSLTKLFSDVEGYEKALAEWGCFGGRSSTKEDYACVASFADLIGGDLDSPEKAATSHIAQISVTGDDWTPGHALTSEPKPYSNDSDGDSPILPEAPGTKPTKREVAINPVVAWSSTIDGGRWKLEPGDVVVLLIQEFGALALEDDEEKLIIEADAGLFNDIVILVCTTIHISSHCRY